MNRVLPFTFFLLAQFATLPAASVGAVPQSPAANSVNFPRLGKIKPRSAKEIVSSSWSIGGETLDRDFGVYANYKRFLGPLGAKAIRLQAGWAKCETKPGIYDFAWLDEVVNDAIAQGVQPWLEVSYGNRLYPEGGGTGLGGALPKSPQARAAWDNWVRAVVRRYQARVNEWEIWNEPDLGPSPAEEYAEFFIRTAEIIRAEQPKARLYALALAHELPYAEAFLARVHQHGKLALMAYQQMPSGKQVVTIWFGGAMPSDSNATTALDITLPRGEFTEPIYADLRVGEVYAIPKANWSRVGNGVALRHIPVYDSRVLVAEKGVLSLATTPNP